MGMLISSFLVFLAWLGILIFKRPFLYLFSAQDRSKTSPVLGFPGSIRSWTRPVLGLRLCSCSVFDPGRSGPVLDRYTPLPTYTCSNLLSAPQIYL